jgi:hypothetical protein
MALLHYDLETQDIVFIDSPVLSQDVIIKNAIIRLF